MPGNKCCIYGCITKRAEKGISFYRFPLGYKYVDFVF